jgi:hypothetical protein
VLDPVAAGAGEGGEKPVKALHVFEVAVATARATELGSIALPEHQGWAWSAGGDRVAFMTKTMGSGAREIVVYGR